MVCNKSVTSNEPLLLTNGNEQIAMIIRINKIAQPVKQAQPGIKPNVLGAGVNNHSMRIT